MSEIGKTILGMYSIVFIVLQMITYLIKVQKSKRTYKQIAYGLKFTCLIPIILLLLNL